jgi:hypothetical protein
MVAPRPRAGWLSEQRRYRQFTLEQKAEIVLTGLRGDHPCRRLAASGRPSFFSPPCRWGRAGARQVHGGAGGLRRAVGCGLRVRPGTRRRGRPRSGRLNRQLINSLLARRENETFSGFVGMASGSGVVKWFNGTWRHGEEAEWLTSSSATLARTSFEHKHWQRLSSHWGGWSGGTTVFGPAHRSTRSSISNSMRHPALWSSGRRHRSPRTGYVLRPLQLTSKGSSCRSASNMTCAFPCGFGNSGLLNSPAQTCRSPPTTRCSCSPTLRS